MTRIDLEVASENNKMGALSNALRKQETRTKIQLGGLVLKSGLADCFDIFPGDDLQLDPQKHDYAMILLGALLELKKTAEKDPDLYQYWFSLGINEVND